MGAPRSGESAALRRETGIEVTGMRETRGFSLVELLFVMVIIGILLAMAIPSFSSTKEKAFDAAAKSDLRNAMSSEEAYFSVNQRYGAMSALTFTTSTGISIGGGGSARGYFLSAKHISSPDTWHVHPGAGTPDDEYVHKE
jgi:type IV pilus assembly protein PilA